MHTLKTEQVLHLFITDKCRHNCKLCCNKFYKIPEIPVVSVELLKQVNTICLTGGDPFGIEPKILADFIIKLLTQYQNIEKLYIYTSGKECEKNFPGTFFLVVNAPSPWLTKAIQIDGINIAPKDFDDWNGFINTIRYNQCFFSEARSNRLYVFEDQQPIYEIAKKHIPQDCKIEVIGRKWSRTFNTPENEHFARLPILM